MAACLEIHLCHLAFLPWLYIKVEPPQIPYEMPVIGLQAQLNAGQAVLDCVGSSKAPLRRMASEICQIWSGGNL